jgi:V8-like Glu-specific endopeptidase
MSSSQSNRIDPAVLEKWFARLKLRDPALYSELSKRRNKSVVEAGEVHEAMSLDAAGEYDAVLETIVREGRPALLIQDGKFAPATQTDQASREITKRLMDSAGVLEAAVPLVGRIDVSNFPGSATYLGTGWLVAPDVIVTNRHVAELIARWDGGSYQFLPGRFGNPIGASIDYKHEADSPAAEVSDIEGVIWIEPAARKADIAFLRCKQRSDGTRQDRIELMAVDAEPGAHVAVIGYPARAPASIIPDQERMERLYGGRYDIKRVAPGMMDNPSRGWATHDCTTLGGNSGSVVLDMKTGQAAALHFAGLYMIENYAVPASTIRDYLKTRPWQGSFKESRPAPTALAQGTPQAPTSGGSASITIPLTITIALGGPGSPASLIISDGGAGDPASAAEAFWDRRPNGVIAVRVGFSEEGDGIGDIPVIAASISADQLEAVSAKGPKQFQGFDVQYFPADATEIVDSSLLVESVDSIDYDDDARVGKGFSFEPVEETMDVRAHVGPEYSWEVLHEFLSSAKRSMVSAMYEFHAPQIKDAIEERLNNGVSLKLVLDNTTFSEVDDPDEEFDRIKVFKNWERKFGSRFERIIVPEGRAGLISDAYHIKVSVREDDTFWLSSGNWKKGSSQPVITKEDRDNASKKDLRGNREWHVVIQNKTLADRFRNHISQDFKRSKDLGGGAFPRNKEGPDIFVDIPIEDDLILERKPASHLIKPRDFRGKIRAKPLLTPDHEGAVYSKAVLDLIRSAKKSLLFQIPYIGMPSNPRQDRGFIDALIKELTEKLKTLGDARVILRSGGVKLSSPTHAAWYFKSKGVDIDRRLRCIDDHHTKGMIVDGRRVLLGSHNWSKPGVTLNRDASLIFDDANIAGYYAEAFEVDWARSNPIKPKRHADRSPAVREAVGVQPSPGYRRIRLSELMKEED